MAAVLGATDPAAPRRASALGQAMQRTNILRDIDEDLGRGRVYLARDTLERLCAGRVPPPAQREALLRDQIARADALYDEGMAGICLLPYGRRAIAAAGAMYREILRQIERDGYHATANRAIVSRKRKLLRRGAHAGPAAARMKRVFEGLFGALVVAQLAYGKIARLRTPAGTKSIVGLLLAASTADAVAARGAARGSRAGRQRRGGRLRDGARGGRDGQAVRPLHVLRDARAQGRRRADPRRVGVGDDGAAVVGGRGAHHARGARARVALAAGALTAWDVFLDPRMAREGYWSWPGGGRYEGIPASNFLGWWVTGAGVFAVWAVIDGDDDPLRDGDGALALYLVDLGWRGRRQPLHLAPSAGRGGGRAGDGRGRRAGAARAAAPAPLAVRVVVVGAGVGGLAAAARLAFAGHAVTVLEAGAAAGGKAGRWESGGFRFDSGPSLLTMPRVFEELFEDTGAALDVELVRVEPVTRYRFADGSSVELSADLPRAVAALEAWSPGSGADWARFMRTCAAMWRASVPFLTGPPPWPPRRPVAGSAAPDPRDFLRVRPWHTLRSLARAHARDPRLRMVIERFATYAGADPRRAPAALAVAGWVEHAFGAWHVRGGIYRLVEALERRVRSLGAELRYETRVDALLLDGGSRGWWA